MNKSTQDLALSAIVWLAFMALTITTLVQTLNLPIVYHSRSQDKCTAVIIKGIQYDCSVIDLENDRYEIVTVK